MKTFKSFMLVVIFSCALILSLYFFALAQGQAVATPAQPAIERVPIRWVVGLGAGTEPAQVLLEQQVVDAFNASQTTISLTLDVLPNESAPSIIRGQIASGNAPDIIGPVGISGSNYFVGQYLDLAPIIAANAYDTSDFNPAHLALYQDGQGHLYGLPHSVFSGFIFYNKDLFDQAGLAYPPHQFGQPYADTLYGGAWTMDKLAEVSRLLTLDGSGRNSLDPDFDETDIVQYGYHTQWGQATGDASLFGSGSFVDAQGDAQIPSAWQVAFHWYYDAIFGNRPFMPDTSAIFSDTFGASNVFNSGKVAMAFTNSWYTCCLSDVPNWDIAVVPSYNSVTTAPIDMDGFRILSMTQHPEEAFQALAYLVGDGAVTLHLAYNGFPARTSQQAGAVAGLESKFPGVDWQVMIDSLDHPDNPNHESYMPNYFRSNSRVTEFYNLYRSVPGLNLQAEIDSLLSDLQFLFHKHIFLPFIGKN